MKRIIGVFIFLMIIGLGMVAFVKIREQSELAKKRLEEKTTKEDSKEKAYKDAVKEILAEFVQHEGILDAECALLYNVWANTEAKKSDPDTDPFAKDANGEFYADPADAIDLVKKDADWTASRDEMKKLCSSVNDRLSKLEEPRDAVIVKQLLNNCVGAFDDYMNTIENTSGKHISTYAASCQMAKDRFDSSCSMLRMNVGY